MNKKETFEEVADEYFKLSHSRLVNEQQKEYERELFIAGYKLAQERMYSEKEVYNLLRQFPNEEELDLWFEKNKKK
jgi:hypothetical protein